MAAGRDVKTEISLPRNLEFLSRDVPCAMPEMFLDKDSILMLELAEKARYIGMTGKAGLAF